MVRPEDLIYPRKNEAPKIEEAMKLKFELQFGHTMASARVQVKSPSLYFKALSLLVSDLVVVGIPRTGMHA